MTDAVMPLAERLLDCLCVLLPETVGGPVCRCCVYPGAQVPVDHCCACPDGAEGQAWVNIRRIYPTTGGRWPQQATTLEPCATGGWAAELVIGVYRCVATLDDQGNPPTCEQVFDDAEKLLSDAAAMRQALLCCFPHTGDDGGGLDMLAGEYVPMGPDGGCAGGQLSVTVLFTECCPDPVAGSTAPLG